MAETKCKYYKQKKQVSYDGGVTWQDVIPYEYQKGDLYEYESADCGALVVYRWINMDASTDYYCEGTTKYYKQKRQVSYDGGQTWRDVSPAEYQKGGVAEAQSTDCGYVPPVVQYRWIKSDDTICVEILYRWINMDASTDYYCEGTTKYYKQKRQVSYDGGVTWRDVTPAEYQRGGVAESQSTDCGYVPPTPTGSKLVATYRNGSTYDLDCNDSSILTIAEAKPSGYVASAMTSAVIGQCVTSIDSNVFSDCSSLTSVTIPNSVTNISSGVFDNCRSLTSVTIPNSVTSIGQYVFYYCTSLTSVTIPDSVTSIGNNVFTYCTSLTSISIGSGITSIAAWAFSDCHSLTSVSVGGSVTSIDHFAFSRCSGLTSVVIPDSVTTIGDGVFSSCISLASVTCLATTPPTLGYTVFDSTNNCPIYVPAESVSAYKTASGWRDYASRIQPIP